MFYQKIFKSFNHSLYPTKGGIPHDVMNYFVSLRIFYASGTQDAEVNKITVKFLNFIAFQVFHDLYELSTKHKFSSYLNHHLHKLSSVDWPVLSRYHRYLLWTGWKSCQEKKNSVHLIMVQEMVQIIYFKISPWQSVTSFRI